MTFQSEEDAMSLYSADYMRVIDPSESYDPIIRELSSDKTRELTSDDKRTRRDESARRRNSESGCGVDVKLVGPCVTDRGAVVLCERVRMCMI